MLTELRGHGYMMRYLELFGKMPFVWRVSLPVLLIAINLLFAWGVAGYGMKVYKRTGSPEESLNHLNILFRCFRIIILLLTMLPAGLFIFLPIHLTEKAGGDFGEYALIAGLLLLTVGVLMGQRCIVHRTIKAIRGTGDSLIKYFGMRLRYYAITLGPLAVIGLVLGLGPREMRAIFWSRTIYPVSLLAAYIIFLYCLTPLTVGFVLKTIPLQDRALLERLHDLTLRAGVKPGKIRVWPTVDSKIAKTVVTGLFHGHLLLTDYMMNSMTPEEIEALVAHELGHLKKRHLWERALFATLWAPLFLVFDGLAARAHLAPLSWPYLLIALILFLLYFRVSIRAISRHQERQADRFVLEIGIESVTLVSALYKMARLNHIKLHQGMVAEQFQTHPSMARRIKWLMLAGDVSDENVGSARVGIL
jgi:STE24 endopeptidase